MIQTVVLSSLHRVFPDSCPESSRITRLTAFKNEPVSFQIAFRTTDGSDRTNPFNLKTESDAQLSCYLVGYVPVLHTHIPNIENVPGPGLYPDMLLPKSADSETVNEGFEYFNQDLYFEKGENTHLYAADDCWQSLWVTFNENRKTLPAGTHRIKVIFTSRKTDSEIGSAEIDIDIVDASLPKQRFIYTNWFHCDCLSDYYNEEVFTDRFFGIIGNYASAAAKNGMNMILMPAFTPALDTPVGKERKTVQLVKITVTENGYKFDFSLMKRFVDVCRRAGIEYFEHAHLFSQWGAEAAPKIIADVNGKEKQIFGWKTKASGAKYRAFLKEYLPALFEFLKTEKLSKKIMFHISDEPNEKNAESYKKAVAAVGGLLDGYMSGDALSHYLFYRDKSVKMPIVCTNAVDNFLGKCKKMWCYYTGGQLRNGLSNRLIVNTPERNRMIGIQMYYLNISGFLHWGYNYYYDVLSHGLFDPKINPCGYNLHPGTSYFVYPGHDGTAIQSTRQKVFGEAINDIRALKAYESLCGRDAAMRLIEKHFGKVTVYTCPETPEQLLDFRADLAAAVSAKL